MRNYIWFFIFKSGCVFFTKSFSLKPFDLFAPTNIFLNIKMLKNIVWKCIIFFYILIISGEHSYLIDYIFRHFPTSRRDIPTYFVKYTLSERKIRTLNILQKNSEKYIRVKCNFLICPQIGEGGGYWRTYKFYVFVIFHVKFIELRWK